MRAQASAVLTVLAALVLSSCSEPFVVPTTMDECHRASPDFEGSSDASSGVMLAFSGADRALGDAGTLYVCLPHQGTAALSAEAPSGVEVAPDTFTAPGDGSVPEVRVTVTDADADGERVAIGYDDGDLGATVFVVIEADGDEWSFAEWPP